MWLVPGCAPVTADSVLRLTLRISLPQQGVDVKFRVKDGTPMLLHVWGDPLWSSPSPYLRTELSLAAGAPVCTPDPQIAKPCSILHCLQCSTSFLAFFFFFFFFLFHFASLCFPKALLMDCGKCRSNLWFGGRESSWGTVICVMDAGQCPLGCQAQQCSCFFPHKTPRMLIQLWKTAVSLGCW